MKLGVGLLTGISALMGLTGLLTYGIYSGCSYCGAVLAGLWGVTVLVVCPICWSLTRLSKENQICDESRSICEHEYVDEADKEVLAWHGDAPIWCTVRAKRCCKCAYVESGTFNHLLDPDLWW